MAFRKQEQQQLQQIMQSTFTNSQYIDQQIGNLIQPTKNQKQGGKQEEYFRYSNPSARRRLSSDSMNDSIQNLINGTHTFHNVYRQSFSSNKQSQNLQENHRNSKEIFQDDHSSLSKDQSQNEKIQITIFSDIEKQIRELRQPIPTQIIKQSYPVYLISQPEYSISDNVFQKVFQYQKIKDKNILLMDIAFCKQSSSFKIAVGTDEGQVIIFQQDHNKAIVILQPFKEIKQAKSTIMALKWSKNLQYLAVSNDSLQVKVYQFKQSIQIENKTILRIMKSPVEYGSVNSKKISAVVNDIYFVSETPLQILCVDQQDQIVFVQFRKHIVNIRPYISILPIKFHDVSNIDVVEVKDQFSEDGVIFAVGARDFVTLCLLKPKFQIFLVYDKQKHGPSRKNGFASVSFRQNPLSLMIVWDKFLQILNINIKTVEPLKYNMQVAGRAFFPQSSIICGFLSNTLVYQISRVGCKVYSANRFSKQSEIDKSKPMQCIHHKLIDFNWVPHGFKIMEFLNNNCIEANELKVIRSIISVCQNTFFITTNNSLQSFRIQKFDKYISNIIDNLNNWKVGLQILKDAYHDIVYQLDGIDKNIIISKLKQYSLRYFGFLKSVIQEQHESVNKSKHEPLNYRKEYRRSQKSYDLWNQQVLFLFNILYETNQVRHLMDQTLPKILQIKPQLIDNLTPFILAKKIKYLSLQSFIVIQQHLERSVIKDLLLNLDPQENQPQLPHELNKILLQEEYYLEIIQINNSFGDQYTPFALMLAKYTALQIKDSKLAKLIGFNSYIFLKEINADSQREHHFAFYLYHNHKKQMAQLMQKIDWFLQLLTQQIYKILLYEEPNILFSYILKELYSYKCLEVLNSLSLTPKYTKMKNDLMTQIIDKISYTQVVSTGSQKQYWICIFQLYGRKIINKNIWIGIKFLTSQQQKVNPKVIDALVESSQYQLKKQFEGLTEQTLKQFFHFLTTTDYISLIRLLGVQLKQYLQVLHCLLGSPKHRDYSLFRYLNQICPLLNQDEIKKFKNILKGNISLFTQIDAYAVASLIGKYFSEYAESFTVDLQRYPSLQLQLVQQILIARNFQASDQLKIKYLELLCVNNKKSLVLKELKKRQTYPIDQSIEICKRYHVLDGYAYMLVKSGGQGDISSAIRIYFEILERQLKIDEQQFKQKMMISLQECIQICIHLDIGGDIHYEQQWFVIMDQLQRLKHKAYETLPTHESERKREVINEFAYPQLVKKLVSKVKHNNIIIHLNNTISRFDVEAVRVIINQLVKNFIYERQVLQLCQQVYIESQMYLRREISQKEEIGFLTSSTCSVCGKREKSILVHYSCGHDIHPFCSNDVKQCILCSASTSYMYYKSIDAINDIKPELYSLAVEGFIESPKLKYRNKANVYQKLEQFDNAFTLQRIYPVYED